MIIEKIISSKIIGIILLIGNIILINKVIPCIYHPRAGIYFLEVGQGDSTLIQTEYSHQILIDGGPDSTILKKLSDYMPFYDKNIELVILTHPHSDHINGILHIINNYHVDHIIHTNVEYDNQTYQQFLESIIQDNIETTIAKPGQKITVYPDVKLDVIYPSPEDINNKDLNDTSISLILVSPQTKALFTGDNSSKVEEILVEKYQYQLDIDLLQTGHHGSKTSTSNIFLKYTSPETAIISYGENNQFNHPHPDTIERLENKRIDIKRTDVDGDIIFDL